MIRALHLHWSGSARGQSDRHIGLPTGQIDITHEHIFECPHLRPAFGNHDELARLAARRHRVQVKLPAAVLPGPRGVRLPREANLHRRSRARPAPDRQRTIALEHHRVSEDVR